MYTKCQIAPSKSVVGVDRPGYALSQNMHSPFFVDTSLRNVKDLIAAILSIIVWGNKLLHAYVQCVYIVYAKYQNVLSKAVVGADRPVYAL